MAATRQKADFDRFCQLVAKDGDPSVFWHQTRV